MTSVARVSLRCAAPLTWTLDVSVSVPRHAPFRDLVSKFVSRTGS